MLGCFGIFVYFCKLKVIITKNNIVMRNLFLLIVWIISASMLHAEVVTEQQALQNALEFVTQPPSHLNRGRRVDSESATIVYTHKMPRSERAAFYIINVGTDAFVLVSADDVAHQVLGYSFNKNFPVGADGLVQLPPHVKSFFDDLAAQMEAAADGGTGNAIAVQRKHTLSRGTNLPASVDPLITTTWDQGQYYNALCPEDANGPGGHVWAGCIATAMAQIVKYWGYPSHGRGNHSYDSNNYGRLEVNYDNSTFDYSMMPNSLTSGSTAGQVNAVATLIFQCGVAANMSYSYDESMSYDVEARAGLINFFRFSPDMSLAEKEFFTDDEWNSLLRENLAAQHPVIYSGQDYTSGHTFVCDGYKAGDYFHFNFGWGGFCDGWYLTSAVNANGSAFNSSQIALVGIVPDDNGHVILGQMTGTSTFTVNEPLEFYNLMGHNSYEGNSYSNPCDNTVTFKPADATKQMVVDVMEFEDQTVNIYNGTGTDEQLRSLVGGGDNDLSPVVSTANALTLNYSGNMYYAGFKLAVSQESNCPMVSNIASFVDNTTVHLTWTENGSATQWQIEYGVKGFELGKGTAYNTTTNTATFENLQKFTEYDFYIRSVNGNQYSQWNKISLMVEAPYWQDVVTSQPEGYVVNEETNTVEISTAEALTWWAKTEPYRNVSLTADIDLSAYKWTPTGGGDFNGNGHVISNVYILEQTMDVGFFSDYGGIVENVGFDNLYVKGKSARTGGLAGQLRGTIRNCYIKNGVVDGSDYTGGLVGESDYGTVINCFVNVNTSGARWASLLIGNSYQSVVRNCYAAGSFRQRAYCYNGGIVAYSDGGAISNCYSVEMPMGVIGREGTTVINDTATFVKTDAGLTLLTPVYFDGKSVTDLLSVLNNWVCNYNDAAINTWVADKNGANDGYPVFGSKHVVQCPNVSDVVIQNVKTGDKNGVSVWWTENGTATQWQVRYRRHDVPNAAYTYVTVTNNPVTIQDIPLGYVYEFNVQATAEGELKSGWSETQYIIVDLTYWTDIVKEQPAGYVEDADGNVSISSTEGLAWLAAKVNGLHGLEPKTFEGKTVTLTADVNLRGYRWNPIGGYFNKDWLAFSGNFDGQGHSISNIYVNDANSDKGLFGYLYKGSIKNVNMVGGYVATIFTQTDGETHSNPSSAIGGLVGYATAFKEITNCHSSVDVYGNANVGSLCGDVHYGEVAPLISNCSASGTVSGREGCGGLIGNVYGQVVVRNSFATGNVNIIQGGTSAWYRGGLIGNFMYATVTNCYSTGTVYADPECPSMIGNVIGCPYMNTHIHYLYGQDDINTEWGVIGNPCEDISNATLFHHNGSQNALSSSVNVGGKEYSDLTEALNAWVTMQNDPGLRTWTISSETGYPVFGDAFVPSCYNPTDLVVSNATTVEDGIIQTKLSWNQTGNPKRWEVLYVAAERDISKGKVISVNSNPCVLTDLPVGKPLDFYVRAVNSEADKSYWSKHVTYIPDNLRWTEVVTSQPEGYREDSEGNIFISSAEGLAWLSSVVNGLNGAGQSLNGKSLYITADIDMSDYRWTPIGSMDNRLEGCRVIGNNHTIKGLYCNELADFMGLIGYMYYGTVSNLYLTQCRVYGENNVGALIGEADYVDIDNCAVSGDVLGIQNIGGIVALQQGHHIANSCFIGNVVARHDISKVNTIVGYLGGICGLAWNDTIVNCYVVSKIKSDDNYTGIITGSCGMPELVANCYYKKYDTTLPIASDGCNTANNSAFTGSGSIWTLSTPSYVNGAFHSDLLDALNAWVDENAEGAYYHWIEDTEGYNSGFPIYAQRHFDVGDVVNVVNFTMNEDATPEEMALYDMNNDMELNIGDVILVVKAVLNQVDNGNSKAREFVDLTKYTAAQFEVKVPHGVQVNDIRPVKSMARSHQVMCLQTDADTYAVVLYSLSNQLLAPEDGNLIEVYMSGEDSERMEVLNMKAAKPTGETVRCYGSSAATSMKVVDNRENSEKVYDLRGIRRDGSQKKGIYIINGKKTVVR